METCGARRIRASYDTAGWLVGHQHSRDALSLSAVTQSSSSSRSAAQGSCCRTKESCGRELFAPHAEPDGYESAATTWHVATTILDTREIPSLHTAF